MANFRFLDIKVSGQRDLQGRFARATTETRMAKREQMRKLGRRTVEVLQENAPVRMGRLRKGIRYHTKEQGNTTELRVTSEAPYTVLVIRGRGPVEAKRAKALRFEPGPPGSGFIFRKRVGPAKANPFQARAFAALLAEGEPEKTAKRIGRQIENAFAGR